MGQENMFLIYCRLLEILESCDNLDSIMDVQYIKEHAFKEIIKVN